MLPWSPTMSVTSALSEQLSECNRQPTSGWSLIRAQTLKKLQKSRCVLQVCPVGDYSS